MAEKNSLHNPITSRQNKAVKQICALSEKKERRKSGLFRFDGIKLFFEAVSKGVKIESVVISAKIDAERLRKVEQAVIDGVIDESRILYVSEEVFAKISEESAPEGIITVAEQLGERHTAIALVDEYFVEATEKILIVESLRDPGNLGTVIRSSSALGIDRLIITDDCADLYSAKTVRATMGALFSLRIDMVSAQDLPKLILHMRKSGRKIYAAALDKNAVEIGAIKLARGDAFVIGNEGHGLSRKTIEAASGTAIIPMTEESESLNASAAATICIWETVKAGKND